MIQHQTLKGIKNHERPNLDKPINEPIEPYICQFCNYKSCTKTLLAKHKEIMHCMKVVTQKLNCEFCDYTTDDQQRLVKHNEFRNSNLSESNSPLKLIHCDICPSKLCSNMALSLHKKFRHKKRKKTGGKYPTFQAISKSMKLPFDCQICGVSTKGKVLYILGWPLHVLLDKSGK